MYDPHTQARFTHFVHTCAHKPTTCIHALTHTSLHLHNHICAVFSLSVPDSHRVQTATLGLLCVVLSAGSP